MYYKYSYSAWNLQISKYIGLFGTSYFVHYRGRPLLGGPMTLGDSFLKRERDATFRATVV